MSSLAKDSRSLVIDLINSDNGTQFGYTDLVLSPPTINNPLINNRNTLVSVTAADTFEFQGNQNVYYDRLDFGQLFLGLTITLGGLGSTDISGLLPELNQTYGLGLTMDDLVAQAFPTTPTYPLNLILVASSTSYAYTGQFSIVVQNVAPQITNNLANIILGTLGTDAISLQDAIYDINTLSATSIYTSLMLNQTADTLRAVAQDVQQAAIMSTQQALDITSLYDSTRSLRFDLTTLQGLVAGLPTQVEIVAQNTTLTNIQTQQTTDIANIAANTAAINLLQTSKMSAPSISSVTVTTPNQLTTTGVVAIAKLAILLKVATDVPCRIRLYPSVTERDADLARSSTTPVPPGLGQLFEGITTTTLLTFYTGPTPFLYNADTPADDNIAYTIQPAVAGVVNVTFTYYGLLQ